MNQPSMRACNMHEFGWIGAETENIDMDFYIRCLGQRGTDQNKTAPFFFILLCFLFLLLLFLLARYTVAVCHALLALSSSPSRMLQTACQPISKPCRANIDTFPAPRDREYCLEMRLNCCSVFAGIACSLSRNLALPVSSSSFLFSQACLPLRISGQHQAMAVS